MYKIARCSCKVLCYRFLVQNLQCVTWNLNFWKNVAQVLWHVAVQESTVQKLPAHVQYPPLLSPAWRPANRISLLKFQTSCIKEFAQCSIHIPCIHQSLIGSIFFFFQIFNSYQWHAMEWASSIKQYYWNASYHKKYVACTPCRRWRKQFPPWVLTRDSQGLKQ